MTTNIQGTRPSNRTGDPTVAETTPTPVITPAAVGGVAVFDRDVNATRDPSLHPSVSMVGDRVPVETRSTGSVLTWIISAVVLILLLYFLLQWVF